MLHAFSVVCAAAFIIAPLGGGPVLSGRIGGSLQVPDPSAAFEGTWTSEARAGWSDRGEPRWQVNLRSDRGDGHWGFGINPAELEGMPAAAVDGTASDVRFLLDARSRDLPVHRLVRPGQRVGPLRLHSKCRVPIRDAGPRVSDYRR